MRYGVLEVHVDKGWSIDCQHQSISVLGKLMEPKLPCSCSLPVVEICLGSHLLTWQHHWIWVMKGLIALWTAISMDACWVVCDGMSMLFTMTIISILHFEWFSYWWQFLIADNTLDAEDDLLNFWVFWIFNSQFPALVASHFHRLAEPFNAISLFMVLVGVVWIFNSLYADL